MTRATHSTNIEDYKICTLASHSALQILKGARDEGIKNLAICERRHLRTHQAFPVADKVIEVESLSALPSLDARLTAENAILIPHGSLINALSFDQITALKMPYFGNKNVLAWEEDRDKQRRWLENAGLRTPRVYESPEDIDGPAIIKFFGPAGGRGYFLTHTPEDFLRKIQEHPGKQYTIQQYIVGTPIYIHYFQSPLTGELEIMSFDKRYESNVDSVGRVAAKDQLGLDLETSYTVVGNMPLVVRESLLSTILEMGEKVVAESKKIDGVGIFGPFCLETVITPELEFIVFEVSARIVAGTNPFINGSPYTDLRYNEPMSTGRRIAREIKLAIQQDRLNEVLAK